MLFKRYLMNSSSLFVLQVILRDHPAYEAGVFTVTGRT